MTKITRSELEHYFEVANTEKNYVGSIISDYINRGETNIPTTITKRYAMVKHLLKQLDELNKTNEETIFVDYKIMFEIKKLEDMHSNVGLTKNK